jgi:hypothetical protein
VPDAKVSARYVEDGFVITGVDTVAADDQTADELAILRDDKLNSHYKARQPEATQADILKGIPGVRVQEFDYSTHKAEFLAAIRQATADNEVVSRYWIDKRNPNLRYLAFEAKLSADSLLAAAA